MSVKSWVRLALVTLIVGGVVGLLAYGFSRDPRHISSPLVGRQAPSFTLTLFDGKTIKLEDLRGKVVFINFWASWCVPCRAEAKALEAGWKKYKDRGVVFLGINIQDKEEDARAFIEEFAVSYMNGRDASGKIAVDYGVWGIPGREEMPAMERLYQKCRDHGFVILGVNVKDEKKSAIAFVKELKITFPIAFDPDGTVGVLYGAWGLPATYLIDANGIALARAWGPADWYSPGARELIKKILDQQK